MESLKFAFEIFIVGALALPWLAVLMRIFSPSHGSSDSAKALDKVLSIVPHGAKESVGIFVILASGYLLGSAVSRISRNVFNDVHLLAFPSEYKIRAQVYFEEYCRKELDLGLPVDFRHTRLPSDLCDRARKEGYGPPTLSARPTPSSPPNTAAQNSTSADDEQLRFAEVVQDFFRLQEGQLLLNGEDKVQRLKEFYDQIDVLRGAAFNGFILLMFCLFGWLGVLRAGPNMSNLRKYLLLLPAYAVLVLAVLGAYSHFHEKSGRLLVNPPLAEVAIFLVGSIGLYASMGTNLDSLRFYLRTGTVAAVLTVISLGGWWWTEVMYDLHVIHAVPELHQPHQSDDSPPAPLSSGIRERP